MDDSSTTREFDSPEVRNSRTSVLSNSVCGGPKVGQKLFFSNFRVSSFRDVELDPCPNLRNGFLVKWRLLRIRLTRDQLNGRFRNACVSLHQSMDIGHSFYPKIIFTLMIINQVLKNTKMAPRRTRKC